MALLRRSSQVFGQAFRFSSASVSPFLNIAQNDFVKIVEVGPRDGLQNEKEFVPTDVKVELINQLSETGLQAIESTAFVSPKWVPQMADNEAVLAGIRRKEGISYPVLTPNMKGLESAIAAGATEVAVFAAASEGFSRKNINCSVAESIARFEPVCERALSVGIKVRGYVSCVISCPFDGRISSAQVIDATQRLLSLGCYEVSLGDTIGVASPAQVSRLLRDMDMAGIDMRALAAHFHDTYGMALCNLVVALDAGIRTVDSSVAGLGGCPYAPGASGNVATESVLYMLQESGMHTGVDLEKVTAVGQFISGKLCRVNGSTVTRAREAQSKSVKR